MEVQENDLLELRLAEQDILRQSLRDKDERIQELEREARYLRDLLNSTLASPRPQPAPLPGFPKRANPVPRRWTVG